MKVLGLILEANPLHNGHHYFINQALEKLNPDYTIAITSTSFNMRGEVSLINKFDKTSLLLDEKIDIVLELPITKALHHADRFAANAIKSLCKMGITDLAFGCEINDLGLINYFVDIITSKDFQNDFKKTLEEKLSYKKTFSKVLEKYLSTEEIKIFNEPNITLAIQYIRYLRAYNPLVKVHLIKRNTLHHSIEFNNNFASGTAIRYALKNNEKIDSLVPKNVLSYIIDLNTTQEIYFNLIKFKYLVNSKNLNRIFGTQEGINAYILENGDFSKNLDSLLNSLKNKNYSLNRINRTLLYTVLNITSIPKCVNYLRILGLTNKGTSYLSTLPKKTKQIIFSSPKEAKKINQAVVSTVNQEILLTKLYGILINQTDLYLKEYRLPIRKD